MTRRVSRFMFLGVCWLLGFSAGGTRCVWAQQSSEVYRDPQAPLEQRVEDLLARLTSEEKLMLLGGTGFGTHPIPRLGVPAMGMCDGPIGVRGGGEGTHGPATVFPCGIAMAATWDPEIVQRIGAAIGREVQNKGVGADVILGPCVNIHRTPHGGRNGESFSEDPYLAARITAAYIRGVQSTGAAACVKHYACNNQEWERGSINVRVDERALREIYLPAFRAAVEEAGVWCVMNAYNKVNGFHCSANYYLLTEVLKQEWGFTGCVMTDWGAAHSTLGVAAAGTDLEMPAGWFMNPERLTPLLEQGKLSWAQIDDKVRRILRTIIRVGLLDGPKHRDNSVVNCPEHRDLVREAGARAIVLLKNDGGLLPLDATRLRSIAVIGPNAAENRLGMGGSGYVTAFTNVSGLEAIRQRVGPQVTVTYAKGTDPGDEPLPAIPSSALATAPDETAEPGLVGEYFANRDLAGEPVLRRTDPQVSFDWGGASPAPGLPADGFSVRWSGWLTAIATGEYTLGVTSDDGARLYLDGRCLIDGWQDHAMETRSARVRLEAGRAYPLRVEYYENAGLAGAILGWRVPGAEEDTDPQIAEAAAAAAQSDVAVVFAGLSARFESEGLDRESLELPGRQNALIKAVCAANPRTVVVLSNGTPVMMDQWVRQVPAILEAWYLGEQGGNSVADVLFGDVNPSGRLPDTLAARREDYPDYGNYPGSDGQVHYAEGIFVGYRHFDRHNIEPLFPFGHGLSYTTFEYGDLQVTPDRIAAEEKATVTLTVSNTGQRAGEEVVQLYVHDPAPQVEKPVRELKRFARVALEPGESKTVTFEVDAPALAYCDVPGKQWRADAGRYELHVGASSRDIRLRGTLELTQTWTDPVPGMASWMAARADDERDLARGRPVRASSVEKPDTPPEAAVDGNDSTRWSSAFSDPQWILVDLQEPRTINRVVIHWEAAFASSYTLQVSLDGETWQDVYTTDAGTGEEETIIFPQTSARYLRMYGRQRGTQYGYSLYSLRVYGPDQ